LPTFLLAKAARAEVKAVLVGEGADELFAGYPTYYGPTLARVWEQLPSRMRRGLQALIPALGAPGGNTTLRFLLRRFLERADAPPLVRHVAWTGCCDAERLAALRDPGGPLAAPPDPPLPAGRTELDALLGFDLGGYLADDLLPKLDRGGMAAS